MWAWLMALLMMLGLAHMMTSCTTTKYVEVPVTKYVTRNSTDSVRDSIYVHDSVTVWMRGDTVFRDRWHTKFVDRWRNSVKSDTVRDTIAKPVYITEAKEVEKPLTWFHRVMLGSGKVLCIALVLAGVAIAIKRRL